MKNKMSAKGRFALGGKIKKLAALTLVVCLAISVLSFSIPHAGAKAKNKTVKDMIVKSTDSDKHRIKAVQGGYTYTVDVTNAVFYQTDKGSKTIDFSDIQDQDVINVKGSFNKRDVIATEIRDLSMTKSATLYGVVDSINSATQTVKVTTESHHTLTVAVTKTTKVTYDGKKRKFVDIRVDDKVLINGTWDNSNRTVTKTKHFDILVKKDYSKLDLTSDI